MATYPKPAYLSDEQITLKAAPTNISMALRFVFKIYACIALLLIGLGARAADQTYERFFGEYEGTGFVDPAGSLETRDLKVNIVETDKGFKVTWVSISRSSSGKTKRKSYTVEFQPSKREGIYSAAMRTDLFGNRVPLDPMSGDPYVWARIDENMLIVYAMLINDDGGYEMQVYERTLTPNGLDLSYSRIRDGKKLRTITANLKRIE